MAVIVKFSFTVFVIAIFGSLLFPYFEYVRIAVIEIYNFMDNWSFLFIESWNRLPNSLQGIVYFILSIALLFVLLGVKKKGGK